MLNPDMAGVDVGSEFHWVCVGADRIEKNVRKFGAYTGEFRSTEVPGFQENTVLTLLAEIGIEMSKWKSDKHFASWLGLCVNKEISSGKTLKNRTRKVCNRASIALRIAAASLRNSNSYPGVFFCRIRSRAGACEEIPAEIPSFLNKSRASSKAKSSFGISTL